MGEKESAGETVYEHNMRYANAIGQHVNDVNRCANYLKKCDYQIFTKKEFADRMFKIKVCIAMIILFSLGTGFAFCMAIGGSNCVRI